MKRFSLTIIVLLFSYFLFGQASTFEKKYSPQPRYQLVQAANNSFYTISFNMGIGTILTHLNSYGDTIWSKIYTCPTCSPSFIPTWDFIKLKDDNILLVQSSWSMGTPGLHMLIKIDTLGNIVWQHSSTYYQSFPTIACEGADSSIHILGALHLTKVDKNGTFQWRKALVIDSLVGGFYTSGMASVNDGLIICGWESPSLA